MRKLASAWPNEDELKGFNTPRLAAEGAVGAGCRACPAVLIPFIINKVTDRGFFFSGDTLLMPCEIPDSQIAAGIPMKFAQCFETPDIFEIPAIEPPGSQPPMIRGVSVLTGDLPENWRGIPVRRLITIAGEPGIVRACHIAQWRQESRFCGSCGAKNNDVSGAALRLCPVCGRQEFPRICPAVIVIITDDENRILLAHNTKFKAGVYSHISGFNEAGETLEDTVAREIREEINIEVRDIMYIKSQPWPFPNSLMLGFSARYSCGTIRPDGNEIEDAAWFTADNLPELPGEGSLSRFLINCWLDGTLL